VGGIPAEITVLATRSWRVLLGLYAGALATGTHWPRLNLGDPERPPDKMMHFAAFGILAGLLWQARMVRSPGRLLAVGMVWCLVDECTQGIPGLGRSVSLYDFVASSLGVAVATALVLATRPVGGELARARRERFDRTLDSLLARPGPWTAIASAAALGALVVVPLAVLLDARLEVRGAGVGPFAAAMLGAGFGVAIAAPAAALAGIRHEDRRLVAAGVFPSAMPTISSMAIVAHAWKPTLLAIAAMVGLGLAWGGLLALRVHSPAAAQFDAWLAGLPKGMTTVFDATVLGLAGSFAIGFARRGIARWIDAGGSRCVACGHQFGPQGASRCPECGVAVEVPSRPA
jgi:hypothetical protein